MNTKFKKLNMAVISALFAVVLVIATVVPASATFTQIRVDSWDIMEIGFDYGSHTSGYAGEIAVSLFDDVDGWGELQAAFCVDLDSYISQLPYDVESMLQATPVEVAWLMDTYSSPSSTTVEGAALQGAIWKVLYEDKFTLTEPSDGDVTKSYTNYLSALEIATIDQDYLLSNYSIVNLDGYQNLIVQNSSSAPVPEPTTMLLFGAGLIGLAGAGRKKIK
ncbi:MAG: PEP-CTERM sorting domain-containing protein [Deltaproteobacteria bacterium]|nr:PEP-CTERM sorting domain-containing protein [Deltaproteobacteria bacterium]